ncbi:hypothetical protein BZA05DRAFT_52370 [Tricharina praecox]|uniref:uncharacterized protein n=1 Tax=Tricharina praecox TaxID=43433 RepID=UPI0022202400|nr:uncharacterized protein BZA05DRAFT_52370 [Tricharina praecox]KAI5850888.1 hypothetical protein BZA05DRAFT_52370 [Tricharina praecox]
MLLMLLMLLTVRVAFRSPIWLPPVQSVHSNQSNPIRSNTIHRTTSRPLLPRNLGRRRLRTAHPMAWEPARSDASCDWHISHSSLSMVGSETWTCSRRQDSISSSVGACMHSSTIGLATPVPPDPPTAHQLAWRIGRCRYSRPTVLRWIRMNGTCRMR